MPETALLHRTLRKRIRRVGSKAASGSGANLCMLALASMFSRSNRILRSRLLDQTSPSALSSFPLSESGGPGCILSASFVAVDPITNHSPNPSGRLQDAQRLRGHSPRCPPMVSPSSRRPANSPHTAILEARRFTDSSHPLGHPEGPPCPGPMPAGQVTCTRNFCNPLNTNTLSVREDPALEAWAGIRLKT